MYDWWIYKHFINSLYFLLVCLTFPSLGAIYVFYQWWKIAGSDGTGQNDSETEEGRR